jgi:hypothetical protein
MIKGREEICIDSETKKKHQSQEHAHPKSTETELNNKKNGSCNKTGSTKIETDKRIQLKMPRTQIEDGQKLK